MRTSAALLVLLAGCTHALPDAAAPSGTPPPAGDATYPFHATAGRSKIAAVELPGRVQVLVDLHFDVAAGTEGRLTDDCTAPLWSSASGASVFQDTQKRVPCGHAGPGTFQVGVSTDGHAEGRMTLRWTPA